MSHPKDTGKEGLTELPKFRSETFVPKWGLNPAGNVRSPFQANALTHSATAPPLLSGVVQSAVKGSAVVSSEGVTSYPGASLTPSKDTQLMPDISGANNYEADGRWCSLWLTCSQSEKEFLPGYFGIMSVIVAFSN